MTLFPLYERNVFKFFTKLNFDSLIIKIFKQSSMTFTWPGNAI